MRRTIAVCGRRKLADEVLAEVSQDILRAVFSVAKSNRPDQVEQFTQSLFTERKTSLLLGQVLLQAEVAPLNGPVLSSTLPWVA